MLNELRSCKNKKDFASLLNISETHLNIVLFSKNTQNRYHTFDIPKKTGGFRTILAPNSDLNELQSKLSNILYQCYEEIQKNRIQNITVSTKSFTSHGFQKQLKINNDIYKLDIYSNAKKHANKRFVFNIDLQNFFETITFSRIVGYFTKNNNFQLEISIAILIAQIATYRKTQSSQGFLPQGSPSSPIISNLIGSILDRKILLLAKKYKLNYSRYVDDITLSTNLKEFPQQIALVKNNNYEVGKDLENVIKKSGFKINQSKTRMSDNSTRQVVTGLTVNRKVNIDKDYYRYTRAMVHSFCKTGNFQKSKTHRNETITDINSLNGIINYIYNIKNYTKENLSKSLIPYKQIKGIDRLYLQFLFHKQFIYLQNTLVIGEGFTDARHLKIANKKINTPQSEVTFKSFSGFKKFHEITRLGDGTDLLNKFINNYLNPIFKSEVSPNKPCIILVDGDKAGKGVVTNARKNFSSFRLLQKTTTNNDLLESYFIFHNFYIMNLPNDICIEKLYKSEVLDTLIDGKKFNQTNKKNKENEYGKKLFLEKVIEKNKESIDFSDFNVIFNTIKFIENDLLQKASE